jgi:cytochrome c-type biogenesis protein CcmH
MTAFVLVAAILTVAVIALVAVPLLKKQPVEYSPAPWAAMVAAGVLAIGSLLLYLHWTTWSWQTKADDDSNPQTMVARLARKLEKEPQDLNGWLMLGRSYTVLQQYQLAERSFRRADTLAGGKNPEAVIGQAEALALSDETELEGRAGRLFERALTLDPNNGKALFFGAASALRRGELPLARERFQKLLAMNPPDNIKPLLQKQIEAIDQQIAGGGGPAVAGMPGAGGPPRAGAPGAGAAADPNARVRITVMLAPKLAEAASGPSPLFVFVRDPARPGPPLAVKRLDSHFPQTVELTASDSMMPGRAITAGEKVQVVARIARSGNPVGASGDPFGESAYMVGRDGLINITIDRVTP